MTSNADDDRILTTGETAALLGVSLSTAQQWIENGSIPSWKTPGGHRRVRMSSVRRLLNANGANAAAGGLVFPSAEEFNADPAGQYPQPKNERARLLALDRLQIIDSEPEPVFDRLTWLASEMTHCPVALLTLLTSQRQWFKSKIGIDATETPRSWAFCAHAILQEGAFMVEDAARDPRFHNNPLVTGEPHIRFYGAFPVKAADGHRLGTLCVIDREPRRLRTGEMKALEMLSEMASEEFSRRTRHD